MLELQSSSSDSEASELLSPTPKQQPRALRKPKANKAQKEQSAFVFTSKIQSPYVVIPSRKRPSSFDLQKSPLFNQTQTAFVKKAKASKDVSEAERHILDAQNSLVEAALYLKSEPKRQIKLLDLIEIFRQYTTNNELPTAANIIAVQTNALERVIRRVKKATSSQQDPPSQVQTSQFASQPCPRADPAMYQSSSPPTSGQRSIPTFADITRRNLLKPTEPPKVPTKGWLMVGRNGKPISEATKPVRLVLEMTDKTTTIKPLLLRDTVNESVGSLGFRELFALSTSKSAKGNLVLTLNSKEARDFAYQQIETLQHILGAEHLLLSCSEYSVTRPDRLKGNPPLGLVLKSKEDRAIVLQFIRQTRIATRRWHLERGDEEGEVTPSFG